MSLQEALKGSLRGDSTSAIVVFADVRSFSQFCKEHDSAEVAIYVSRLFLKFFDQFKGLVESPYYKSTGDGLMMVFPYEEEAFEALYRAVVDRCVNTHDSFAELLAATRAINFSTPHAVGFSVVRGAVSALTSRDAEGKRFVVDYAGHRINLAARLQDLARPSGVILEGSKDMELLSKERAARFKSHDVYIRSVAETKPIKIWCLEGVKLQQINLTPMEARWRTLAWSYAKDEIEQLPALECLPVGKGVIPDTLIVRFKRPEPSPRDPKRVLWYDLVRDEEYKFESVAGTGSVNINMRKLRTDYAEFIEKCPADQKLTVEVIFQALEP